MRTHRLDLISLLFGIITVVVGLTAVNARLGRLINNRPDGLIPLLVLAIGLAVVAVATRRSLQDVDGARNDQHDGAE